MYSSKYSVDGGPRSRSTFKPYDREFAFQYTVERGQTLGTIS